MDKFKGKQYKLSIFDNLFNKNLNSETDWAIIIFFKALITFLKFFLKIQSLLSYLNLLTHVVEYCKKLASIQSDI